MSAPGAVGSATDGNCNSRTLTSEGHALINALMDHEMIIDVGHTDTPTFEVDEFWLGRRQGFGRGQHQRRHRGLASLH